VGAINVDGSNLITIELKKPLNSGDSAGGDVQWSVGNTHTLIIMWDSNGGGSDGGTRNHQGGFNGDKTVFINTEVIPEIQGLALFAVLVALAVAVIILRKRTKQYGTNETLLNHNNRKNAS
jgi:hypothetical protein